MITLYGVTEDGTSVPVQVTDDGRIVAQGLKGEPGKDGADSQVPGPPGADGPPGPPGEYGQGDDVQFGTIDADSTVTTKEKLAVERRSGQISNNTTGISCAFDTNSANHAVFYVKRNGVYIGQDINNSNTEPTALIRMKTDGSFAAAQGNCGFTKDGELFFRSRNQMWKAVVQGGNVMAEEFTRTTDIVLPDE